MDRICEGNKAWRSSKETIYIPNASDPLSKSRSATGIGSLYDYIKVPRRWRSIVADERVMNVEWHLVGVTAYGKVTNHEISHGRVTNIELRARCALRTSITHIRTKIQRKYFASG